MAATLPGPWVIWYEGKPVRLVGGIDGAVMNGFRWEKVDRKDATQFPTFEGASGFLRAMQFSDMKHAEIAPLHFDNKDHPDLI